MGRNGVKSVTAIRTLLLARVRALRHGFTTVITGIRALGPGDSGFLMSCWVGSQTPPPYLHHLRVHSRNADLLESIVGSVPHGWYAKDTQRINFSTLPWVVYSS
ncbi:hypothetical protein PIB30_041419 [Stylosanthes scabra]|uniref:Uncharacterized protein n=1 Tax=Stylosanthes scabra TaxID=79078 RepID=A0ABU6VEJ2_9FABA|nr:hypothetical protein [Stylosanthes scabra]